MDFTNEESKDGLLGTIKVPRNLGQITERLPKAKYHSNPNVGGGAALKRNSSEMIRGGIGNQLRSDL